MALPFTITAIEVPPLGQFPRQTISTGFGLQHIIHLQQNILASRIPVAFALDNLNVHFTLRGDFPFNAAWRASGSRYVVEGNLGPVRIQSAQSVVPLQQDNNTVVAQGFTFVGPTVPNLTAPFKCTGYWRWTITHITPLGVPVNQQADLVTSEQSTHIEAYFFLGSSIFIPHVAELLRFIVHDLVQVNAIVGDPIVSYAGHIARTMWNFGGPAVGNAQALQYDIWSGTPYYFHQPQNAFGGGQFNLGLFLGKVVGLCNCYDLAGIIQVCCRALGNRPDPTAHDGAELPFIDTKWSAMVPFGYVPPGPLFGRQNFINVNNPGWGGQNPAQHFTSPMDPTRTHFDNHVWIEFQPQAGHKRVLDVTHGRQTPPGNYVISEGQQDRWNYVASSTEDGPNTNAWNLWTLCYMVGVTQISV